ncbi:PREDICTED: lysosome-associated membrane glycoprotein 1 [Gekko japonicus]|uniref:Lysosome-associated membrane glycoprotein 1 n=1 Tax=Gekko japonicus TaxID=146911 RepID=A0ABM1K0L0_GEKJA|nr:PREDICTED: lysosome-associated membrane glycoprotein 1 [Gekko japonicus]
MAARSGRGLLLLTAVLLGFLQASSTFEVKEGGKVCILAYFSVEFTVEYDTKSQKQNATIVLPHNATVLNSSSCGVKEKEKIPVLALGFGNGHSLTLDFDKNAVSYSVRNLTLRYNMSDAIFPDSTEKGMQEATSDPNMHAVLNTTYTCVHSHRITMTNVTVLFQNVTIEAYLASNNFSHNYTFCKEDQTPITPATPTTSHVTTTTSHAPPTPSKNPDKGQYNVTGPHGTCLLASMGLQLNVTYGTKSKTKSDVLLNVPLNTTYAGICENTSVTLNLFLGSDKLVFHFVQNASIEKYFLQGIDINITLPSEAEEMRYNVTNNSLSELKATVGRSFKCVAEETIWVSDRASVNVFDVQIQAFKFEGDKFGAVEECQLDENNMLIPIIVGAALAGLVLIVLIAYLIGRKRSHAGYQTI